MKYLTGAIILFFLISGCNSGKTPKDAKEVDINAKRTVRSNSYTVANFTLQLADSWEEETPSNSMRVTQFKLKKYPEYQVVVSYFGPMDNQLEENISRWKNQFSSIDEFAHLELKSSELTAIKILGTYKKKAFPMANDFVETPNYGTLAALIPSSEGPYFLKLTAIKEIIEAEEINFIEVLNSYSLK